MPPHHLHFFSAQSPHEKSSSEFLCVCESVCAGLKYLLDVAFPLAAVSLDLQIYSKHWTTHCHRSLTQTVLSPSSQYCQINSSAERMAYGNIIVNIIVTSAFVTSWIDLLIHCFLILQNMQLKDAPVMNTVARTWIGTTFPLRVLKFLNLLSKIFQFNFTITPCYFSLALLTKAHYSFCHKKCNGIIFWDSKCFAGRKVRIIAYFNQHWK